MDESTGSGTVHPVELGFAFTSVVGFVFGAITASFLCVVAERIPAGASIGGRSHCACGRQLRNRENIPVIGYLRTGGVARCCGARLPSFYLWGELFLALWWAMAMVVAVSEPVVGAVLAGAGAAALVAAGVELLGD